jgi:protein-S-isoprenylcysteine O-methyltransferase Ste14
VRPYFVAYTTTTVLFVCTAAVWAFMEIPQALKRRPNATSADRGSLLIIRVCAVVAIVIAGFAVARVPRAAIPDRAIAFGIGLALMWAGIGLRWWSFSTLGRYFTFTVMTSVDQPIITGGPYRAVRHPSYLGILLALTGIGAMYGNWLSLAALACVPLIGFVHRIHVEEAALSAPAGTAYTSYASGRKRLIPFFW